MLCRVTQHRELGRPLKRSELAEPVLGHLEWMPNAGSQEKPFPGVYLYEKIGVAGHLRPAIAPLFDPWVRSIKDQLMVIQGTQMAPGDVETVQVWSIEILKGNPA